MKCNHCGSVFEGNFCPECGARVKLGSSRPEQQELQLAHRKETKSKKKKKPFFLRWWFLLIIVIVVFAAFIGREETDKIVWEDMVIGQMLPEAPGKKGKIWNNSSEELHIDINKITEVQYENYVQACKDNGFTIDEVKDSYSYKAYNSEGYKLYVNYSSHDSQMGVELDIPMEMTEIKWPAGPAGKQLPKPESNKGKFLYEYDDSFFVYIGDTSKRLYNEYVAACADKGFNADYDKGETYYYADNSEGWHIYLKYEGFNIMSIDIDAPDDYDEEPTQTENKEPSDDYETTETSTKPTTTEKEDDLVDGMRPEFITAMDSYETFMTDYVDFMKKFEDNPNDLSILTDYADYMKKYADFVEDFEKWDDDEEMNTAETAYYIDVQARVSKKLLEIS